MNTISGYSSPAFQANKAKKNILKRAIKKITPESKYMQQLEAEIQTMKKNGASEYTIQSYALSNDSQHSTAFLIKEIIKHRIGNSITRLFNL